MVGRASELDDILIAPIGTMIRQVGEAVADAQATLHESYLRLHEQQSPELKALGVLPSWYELSQVDVELKLALHVEAETRPGKSGGIRLFAASHNADYQNSFSYSADGASILKLRLSPVPPPLLNPASDS